MNEITTKLSGEGDVEIVRRERVRVGCDNCGENATHRHTYLLPNARRNPSSTAYRHDDCTWCSDYEFYTCDECKQPTVEGYEWCSTFDLSDRFAHMFLRWSEKKIPADGLTVSVGEDGVWLAFQPKSGVPAMVRVDAIADARGPITRRIILAWADERRAAHTTAPAERGDMAQYRKKPVVIEALLFDGSVASARAISDLVNPGHEGNPIFIFATRSGESDVVAVARCCTLEGQMEVSIGDFVIRGIKGECYPCKPDIFAASYEPATEPPKES